MHIDLDDPEVGQAALKIQSSFRGHQARKEVEIKKNESEGTIKPGNSLGPAQESPTTDGEAFDSGTSMSSQNSIKSNTTVVPSEKKTSLEKSTVIKVQSIEKSPVESKSESLVDSGSELLSEDNSFLDMSDESSPDSSETAPIRSKRAPFSLLKYFVTMITLNTSVRKHKVGVIGNAPDIDKEQGMSKSISNVSKIGGESNNKPRKLTKRFSKSRNSVASEPSSSSSTVSSSTEGSKTSSTVKS